jgi:hypothetical protein
MKHATISRHEAADDYFAVIAQLSPRWRVIECPDGVQWVLQYRFRAETSDKPPWKGRSFCRTREALIRCITEHADDTDPAQAEALLAHLPERRS